jgi:hypothetical protein
MSRSHEGHYLLLLAIHWLVLVDVHLLLLVVVYWLFLVAVHMLLCLPFERRETYCFSLIFSSA